ncbi:NAD-dependent epimerase/dehydratase family protein [Geodermatophilus sp. SYSU D00815]
MAKLDRGHLDGLTVAVTGATGNVGTALLRRLTGSGAAEVRGLARREPPEQPPYDRVRWTFTDLGEAASEQALPGFLEGADAVVHLAWALQPGRHPEALRRVNVEGTRRVVRAAAAAGVGHVVHMSSLGAYAPGSRGQVVTEDWPTTGIPTSQYSRDKAEAERAVREIMTRHPEVTSSVVRPTLVMQPAAASEIGRYFLGPLLYPAARLLPAPVAQVLPLPLPQVTVGFVHADDVADALERILDRRAPGAFNLSAEPTMDADAIAKALGTVRVPVPAPVLRAALHAAFTAHLVPTEPGWLDLALQAPALDTTRARRLLDWAPFHRGDEVLAQFVAAFGRGEGAPGPLLQPAGGPVRDPDGDPGNAPGPRAN